MSHVRSLSLTILFIFIEEQLKQILQSFTEDKKLIDYIIKEFSTFISSVLLSLESNQD